MGDHTPTEESGSGAVSRRSFLRWGALAAAATPALASLATSLPTFARDTARLEEATIADLQAAMESGELTASDLVEMYLERIEAIDRDGPTLRAVLEINPDAQAFAERLDGERKAGRRGPLLGIPILLKDNIDTHDRLHTTAGSLALMGSTPPQDASVTARLREAGAIILGKANLSEWANFRGFRSVSGWSGRGRQGKNPYVLDRSPCTSSSGSAAAVAANLVAGALGTETNGSIVCPSSVCGVVGIKPTLGLVSVAGVIPIGHSQDVVGPICRTVADAAAVLTAIAQRTPDPRDPATAGNRDRIPEDYTKFLKKDALQGKRVGILRNFFLGKKAQPFPGEHIDAIAEPAVKVLQDLGATTVNVSLADQLGKLQQTTFVLEFEFKGDLNKYLSARGDPDIHTLADLIAFNDAHSAEEMPYFLQQIFEESQAIDLQAKLADHDKFQKANQQAMGPDGIDKVMTDNNLDALFAPTRNPAWTIDLINGDRSFGASSTPAAIAGYPNINVPAGNSFGELPVGVAFIGRAFSEKDLIGMAFAFEQATRARKPPKLLPTLNLP